MARGIWRHVLLLRRSHSAARGFSDEVDEEIIKFVERCSGTFDLGGEITGGMRSSATASSRPQTHSFSRSVCEGG
jgi:hypothetical protein